MTNIRYVLLLAILVYAAWKDKQCKSIPYYLPAIGIAIALLCRLLEGLPLTETLPIVCQALLPGCFLLLTAFFTGQKVGYGDGLMVLVVGVFTNVTYCILSLMFGLCVSCLFAMFYLVLKKVKMKDQIPFLPFLLIGYIFTLAVLTRIG